MKYGKTNTKQKLKKIYHPSWKSNRLSAAILSSNLSEYASAHSQSTAMPISPPCSAWSKQILLYSTENSTSLTFFYHQGLILYPECLVRRHYVKIQLISNILCGEIVLDGKKKNLNVLQLL